VELVRRVVDGGKISYKGREFEIPWPGSDAVPMRLSMRAEHEIPILPRDALAGHAQTHR
jgi:hypothetical protein